MKLSPVKSFVVSPFIVAWISACALEAPSSAPAALSKQVSPALASVKPPRQPKANHFHISEAKLALLPKPEQPKALTDALLGLQAGSIDERVVKLKAKALADMVYVQGGSFMRGDFAKLMGVEGVTRITYNEDDKVVREITLSDFWIGKYKTTYAEFDVFTDATGRPRTGMDFNGKYRHPVLPAGAYWKEAKDYCQWLGKITGQPFDLPTEAQWEYAARSRGQFFMIATDDGNIEYGRNVPYGAQERVLAPTDSPFGFRSYPIALFPPNPLGLYDMTHDGKEWVNDWYASNAYEQAEARDPKGPASGERKVTRGWGRDDLKIGAAVWRRSAQPVPVREGIAENDDRRKLVPVSTDSAPQVRCVAAP